MARITSRDYLAQSPFTLSSPVRVDGVGTLAAGAFGLSNTPNTSALSVFIAAMSPGTWAQFPTGADMDAAIFQAYGISAPGPIFVYTNNANWDPIRRRIVFTGAQHNTPARQSQYDEATNLFSIVHGWYDPPGSYPAGGGVQPRNYTGHMYNSHAVDPYTGNLYVVDWGIPEINRYIAATDTWEKVTATNPIDFWFSGPHAGIASTWWKTPNTFFGLGMHGGLVYIESINNQLQMYDPLANDYPYYTAAIEQEAQSAGTYQNIAVYLTARDCLVYGGGNAASGIGSSVKLWRMDADGSQHYLTDAPLGIGVNHGCLMSEEPGSGNIVIFGFGDAYMLDPVAQTGPRPGVWTQLTGAADLPSDIQLPEDVNAGQSNCIVSLPQHGAVGIMNYVAGRTPRTAKFWIYKHV